jgi:elongation of very long chain fatty acids protein 6
MQFFGGDSEQLNSRAWHPGTPTSLSLSDSWYDNYGWRGGEFVSLQKQGYESTVAFFLKHFEIPIGACILYYLLVVVGLQRFMATREAYSLRMLLSVWNFGLAALSVVGTVVLFGDIYANASLPGRSYVHDMCEHSSEFASPVGLFFALSKFFELLDTVFLALRKRPVIFLHWYHHIATLLYCWFCWANLVPTSGWFCAMNLLVHSIMYSYYFVMSLGIFERAPPAVAMAITSLQIAQMIGGLTLLYFGMQICPTTPHAPDDAVYAAYTSGIAMYLSYAILFGNFFFQRYVKKKEAKKEAQTTKSIKAD